MFVFVNGLCCASEMKLNAKIKDVIEFWWVFNQALLRYWQQTLKTPKTPLETLKPLKTPTTPKTPIETLTVLGNWVFLLESFSGI